MGLTALASSVEARAGEKVVRIGFSNSYRGTADDGAILRVTGEKGARFFKQSFELKIKGDLIPEAAEEPLIGELQAPPLLTEALTSKAKTSIVFS